MYVRGLDDEEHNMPLDPPVENEDFDAEEESDEEEEEQDGEEAEDWDDWDDWYDDEENWDLEGEEDE